MEPSATDPIFSQHYDTMSHLTAVDYDLAGRLPVQPFLDLRSASKARRRHRANLEKYWSYRAVNAGQVGRPHYELPVPCYHPQALPSHTPVATMTKQELYQEAQRYPRPPKYHRKHVDFLRGPKTARKDRERHARRHAHQDLEDEVAEARDPMYTAYVTGTADDERDFDHHVFRGCEVCWPELGSEYVDFEMVDCNGEVVGVWDDCWEMGLDKGFAGRSNGGAVFLQGVEDVRNWSRPQLGWRGWWEENDEGWDVGKGGEDGGEDESWSWADVGSLKYEGLDAEGAWEMLSSCSSWSEVSG